MRPVKPEHYLTLAAMLFCVFWLITQTQDCDGQELDRSYRPQPTIDATFAPPQPVQRVYVPQVIQQPRQVVYSQPVVPAYTNNYTIQQSNGGPALAAANRLRAARGLPPIRYDPRLQAACDRSSQRQAQRGFMHHTKLGFGPGGRYEGVGQTNSEAAFLTCYLYTPGSPTGAASSVRSGNKVFHTLQLSGSDSPIVNTSGGGRNPVRQIRSRLFRRR